MLLVLLQDEEQALQQRAQLHVSLVGRNKAQHVEWVIAALVAGHRDFAYVELFIEVLDVEREGQWHLFPGRHFCVE